MQTALGRGVYDVREAAQLAQLKPARIREWFRPRPDKNGRRSPFVGDYEPNGRHLDISFHDLVDAHVGGHLREGGIAWATVRALYTQMQERLGSKHAFCRKELLTDGKQLLLESAGAEHQREFVSVLGRQGAFAKVILPFLKKLDYDEELLARRWHIAPGIVVDPAICFGAPIVAAVRKPAWILAAAYRANDEDTPRVAYWYGVSEKDILDAVAFEKDLAA